MFIDAIAISALAPERTPNDSSGIPSVAKFVHDAMMKHAQKMASDDPRKDDDSFALIAGNSLER